jgi:hypothetical protein
MKWNTGPKNECQQEKLKEAVAAAGTSTAAVRDYLTNKDGPDRIRQEQDAEFCFLPKI